MILQVVMSPTAELHLETLHRHITGTSGTLRADLTVARLLKTCIGDAIVIRTVEQVVFRVQTISRELLAERSNTSVADFIADRRLEAGQD